MFDRQGQTDRHSHTQTQIQPHRKLEDTEVHVSRRGGGESSACRMDEQQRRLEDAAQETGGHQGALLQEGWRRKLCLQDEYAAQETGGQQAIDLAI